MVLLDRCQLDDDDEVRDRATMYVNILAKQMKMDSASDTGVATNNNEMGLITDGLPEGKIFFKNIRLFDFPCSRQWTQ